MDARQRTPLEGEEKEGHEREAKNPRTRGPQLFRWATVQYLPILPNRMYTGRDLTPAPPGLSPVVRPGAIYGPAGVPTPARCSAELAKINQAQVSSSRTGAQPAWALPRELSVPNSRMVVIPIALGGCTRLGASVSPGMKIPICD